MCLSKIRGIFSKAKRAVLPKREIIREKPPRKWWQFPFRFYNPSRGGQNMPKFQPCPQCHAESKRLEKTMGGANYFCRRHGRFFIQG